MTPINPTRLFAEDRRRAEEAWTEYRAEKQRRLAELDRMHARRIAPQSVEYALTRFAALLWIGIAGMALAGLIAGVM
jgi:hypothetical protein